MSLGKHLKAPKSKHSLPASRHLSGYASCRILLRSFWGTMAGVWAAWAFTDPAGEGVEAAEELAKATGVCEQSTERPVGGLHGSTDTVAPAEDCLFLRRAAAGVSRWFSHNILGCVILSLEKCTPCVHLDTRMKSSIFLTVSF